MRNRWGFCALGATCMWAGCSGGGGASGGLELSDVRGDGGLIGQLIVSTSDEPAGDHCAAGGVALASGVDDNGDGALSPTEVSSTRYVCNGGPPAVDAQPGTLVSSKVLEEGDANCPGGGVAISQGVDANRNGKLDAKEVSGTAYACNGDPIELASTCTFPAIWDDTAAACVAKSDWASADLSGQDLSSSYLAGLDASGADLSDAKLSWSDLRGVDFTGASLTGADLSHALVDGASFTDAKLDGADLQGVDLSDATLDGVSATHLVNCPDGLPDGFTCIDLGATGKTLLGPGATLTGLDLTGADLSDAPLDGVQITGLAGCPAELPQGWQCLSLGAAGHTLVGPGADLSGLDLTGADFSSITNLRDVRFDGATLTNAVFASGTNLDRASFDGANLSGASLSSANLSNVDFDGANLSGANLGGANLNDAKLGDATLTNLAAAGITSCPDNLPSGWRCISSNLVGPTAQLPGVTLTGADLTDVSLADANLSGANLSGANLSGIDASGANLSSANLSSADLQDIDLTGANLTSANLTSADLSEANLTSATLTSATLTSVSWDNTICPSGVNSNANGDTCP